MKRITPVLLAALLVIVLAACSGSPVKEAYTAAGDSERVDVKLSKTSTFRGDDDLNVVLKLNAHRHTLRIKAVFTPPAPGQPYVTDEINADKTVPEVILGLDWDYLGAGNYWPAGEWQVDVYVDDDRATTKRFTVEPVAAG